MVPKCVRETNRTLKGYSKLPKIVCQRADDPTSKYQFEVIPLVDRLPAGRLEFQDTLTIRTDSAKAGEITVPLSIRIKQ